MVRRYALGTLVVGVVLLVVFFGHALAALRHTRAQLEQARDLLREAEISSGQLAQQCEDLQAQIEQLQRPLSYVETSAPYGRVFIAVEAALVAMPRQGAPYVNTAAPGSACRILEVVETETGRWYRVTLPLLEAPVNSSGWIHAELVTPYTRQLMDQVLAPVSVREGTLIYDVGHASDIGRTDPVRLAHTVEGRVQTRRDDYTQIASAGGWSFWVRTEHVVVPDPN